MLQTDALESAIRLVLVRVGTCTLEELNERVPYYSWNQVFAAVDRLNRAGAVIQIGRASCRERVLQVV